MFVDVVQNVYRPNGVIPSAIRAYLVKEEVAEFGAEAMNYGRFARVFEPTFKFFDGLAHREFGAFSKNRGYPLDRLSPSVVQSTIKVVDSISQQECEIIECRRICELMYKAFGSGLRVNLNSGSITFMKSENACFDIADMTIGPLNL